MRRYRVVAHRTLGGPHVFDHLKQLRSDDAHSEFHVVVPKYHSRELMWAEGTTNAIAKERLDEMLETLEGMGINATGEVGSSNPMKAINEVVERFGDDAFSGIILSTLPRGISRWWSSGVPGRIEKQYPSLPLTHLVAATSGARS